MSVLLLVERRRVGKGPKIPLRGSYTRVKVEGLAEGLVAIACTSSCRDRAVFHSNGIHKLEFPYAKGEIVCGEVDQEGSCVTLQLEE